MVFHLPFIYSQEHKNILFSHIVQKMTKSYKKHFKHNFKEAFTFTDKVEKSYI